MRKGYILMSENMHNILIFCSIVLAAPFIMFGLYKYITWISNTVEKNENDRAMQFLFKALIIPAPIIFAEFGIVMYAMIRDYGWGALLIPVTVLMAMRIIHWLTKDWEV